MYSHAYVGMCLYKPMESMKEEFKTVVYAQKSFAGKIEYRIKHIIGKRVMFDCEWFKTRNDAFIALPEILRDLSAFLKNEREK